ncbi:hypothetical protein AVEN_167362-2-1, partial [Araneus ventricosus]
GISHSLVQHGQIYGSCARKPNSDSKSVNNKRKVKDFPHGSLLWHVTNRDIWLDIDFSLEYYVSQKTAILN